MASEQTRNDPFSLLSWMSAEKVAAARIMVVGCGALGNEVLKNLALLGAGHLTLVDFDRVEPRNLSRSILFTEQIPYLTALEEGIFVDGEAIVSGQTVRLYHGKSFSIGNTTFTYIEKDL